MAESLRDRAQRLYEETAGKNGDGDGGLGVRMGRFARMMGLDCWSSYMILGGLVIISMVMHPSLLTLMLLLLTIGWQFIIREVAHLEGAKAREAGTVGIRWAVLVASLGLIAFAVFVMLRVNWLAL